MVRQAMTSSLETLLALEHTHSCLAVIPARAGIQSNPRPKDTTFFELSAAHGVCVPQAGLRRQDERSDGAHEGMA